jgi:hypothetical protein
MLYLVPLTVTVAVWPFADILMDHITTALYASYYSKWANEVWWDRTASWVLCAGPFGRWIVGTILGYVVLAQQRARASSDIRLPGDMIEEPHLRIALIMGFPFLVSCFTLVSRCVYSCPANSLTTNTTHCTGSGSCLDETDFPRCNNIRGLNVFWDAEKGSFH